MSGKKTLFFSQFLRSRTVAFGIGIICGSILNQSKSQLKLKDAHAHSGDEVIRRDANVGLNPIMKIDHHQIILSVNQYAATFFGVQADEMEGSSLTKFIVDWPDQSATQSTVSSGSNNSYNNSRAGRRFNDHFFIGRHASGKQFPIAASTTGNLSSTEEVLTIVLKDATLRQHVNARLARSHDELRRLSTALQTIREEERTHIARELHDELGQLLSTLKIDLSIIQQQNTNAQRRSHLIEGMQENIGRAFISLRRIAANLRPRALDEGDLYAALKNLCKEFSNRYGFICQLYADENELQLEKSASTTIFRIVQEALTNIGRHANAQTVEINIYRSDGELLLGIHDDGVGITEADLSKNGSLGLIGMRERVWGMHGDINVGRGEPNGTSIDIVIPIGAHQG